jgi:POT family proton-dependent oligopeptide transporter
MGQAELTAPSSASVDTVPNTHPPAFWFFFWGEFAERASYYGMRAILFVYLTNVFRMTDTGATRIQAIFKMACYILPLAGGYIADRWLGRYWTIVGFSLPYVLGHFILGIPHEVALGIALALLAGGSGVIKPNISTLLGETYDQKRPGKKLLRSAAFSLFYLSINIGSFISTLAMPEIKNKWGFAVAFQFPAWLMVLSLAVFALGKRHYALSRPVHREKSSEERKVEWRALGRLLGLFALIVFFWAAYEQNDNLWLAFLRDYGNLDIGLSEPITEDQLQFINPLFVILLIPAFNWLFKKMDPQIRIFTPMRKIFAGFLLTAASAGLMSAAGFLAKGPTEQHMVNKIDQQTKEPVIDPETDKPVQVEVTVSTVKVSVLWFVMAYIVLTCAEVLLYGTALELSYAAAPESMKGMVTACFLVTIMLGNFVNAFWSGMYGGSLNDPTRGPLQPGEFFGITALAVVAVSFVFHFVGKRFERGMAQDAAAATV